MEIKILINLPWSTVSLIKKLTDVVLLCIARLNVWQSESQNYVFYGEFITKLQI
jgi:hypothetical protein